MAPLTERCGAIKSLPSSIAMATITTSDSLRDFLPYTASSDG
jgi:hypothetical protein